MLGGDNVLAIAAGLPNITGSLQDTYPYITFFPNATKGALSASVKTKMYLTNGEGSRSALDTIYFDASKANSIYGNSETVMPVSFSLIPQIRY